MSSIVNDCNWLSLGKILSVLVSLWLTRESVFTTKTRRHQGCEGNGSGLALQDASLIEPAAVFLTEETRIGARLVQESGEVRAHFIGLAQLLHRNCEPVSSFRIGCPEFQEELQELDGFVQPARMQVSLSHLAKNVSETVFGLQSISLFVLLQSSGPILFFFEGPAEIVVIVGVIGVDF